LSNKKERSVDDCKHKITRRQFLKTSAAGIALGLVGSPSFSVAKEEYDLAVISGEPVAATRKALPT
jgi:anaerobic selenocysteine-containing dehydrogenase